MNPVSNFNLENFIRRHGKPPNTILMHENDFQRIKDHYVTSVHITSSGREIAKTAKHCSVGNMQYMGLDIMVSEQVEEGKIYFAIIEKDMFHCNNLDEKCKKQCAWCELEG